MKAKGVIDLFFLLKVGLLFQPGCQRGPQGLDLLSTTMKHMENTYAKICS
jgi:hypothetical protein